MSFILFLTNFPTIPFYTLCLKPRVDTYRGLTPFNFGISDFQEKSAMFLASAENRGIHPPENIQEAASLRSGDHWAI